MELSSIHASSTAECLCLGHNQYPTFTQQARRAKHDPQEATLTPPPSRKSPYVPRFHRHDPLTSAIGAAHQSIGFSSFVSLSYLLTVRSIWVKRSRLSLPTTAPLKEVSSSATVVPDAGICARSSAAVGNGMAVGEVAAIEKG